MTKGKLIFLILVLALVVALGTFFSHTYLSWSEDRKIVYKSSETSTLPFIKSSSDKHCSDWKSSKCSRQITFLQLNKSGEIDSKGQTFAIILNPKSPGLDFKVTVPLSHKIYQKDDQGKYLKNYTAKNFTELIADQNALLDGQKPIAAINADYIDELNNPQGFNISRGVDYSGDFSKNRSSFAISGGKFDSRVASIQIGPRTDDNLHFNAVGGNGRFYTKGVFEDICSKLGEYACNQSTNRSMVAITSDGWVIFLAHQSIGGQRLLPGEFDDLLGGLAKNQGLGNIVDGMLFDGGDSPAIMYENQIYVQNGGSIGSAFLIYGV